MGESDQHGWSCRTSLWLATGSFVLLSGAWLLQFCTLTAHFGSPELWQAAPHHAAAPDSPQSTCSWLMPMGEGWEAGKNDGEKEIKKPDLSRWSVVGEGRPQLLDTWMFCARAHKTWDRATWSLFHCCCGAWTNWISVCFFFLKEESSLKGSLSCPVLICFPIPRVILKLPLLTCHILVQGNIQALTAKFPSPPLPFSSASALSSWCWPLTWSWDRWLPHVPGNPGVPGPSKDQASVRNSPREWIWALALDFLAGTCLCVVCLEFCAGKSFLNTWLPSFFKTYVQQIRKKIEEKQKRWQIRRR